MLLNYLKSIKDKVINYCFWCLNQNFNIENFPQPCFETKNVIVEGLYVKWYTVNRKLRSSNGTTSQINLLEGLKTFSIGSCKKVIKEEVRNLVCEVSILHTFEKIEDNLDWIVKKHGLKSKSLYPSIQNQEYENTLLFLPNEESNNILLTDPNLIRFQSLIFEGIYFEKRVNFISKIYLQLNGILKEYFNLNEYKTYKSFKNQIFEMNGIDFDLKDKVLKVLRAEFYNFHWILLEVNNNKLFKKRIIKSKSKIMDYLTNEIGTINCVLENFRINVEINPEWECDIAKSYFFNLDNKKISVIKYLKFQKTQVKFKKLEFSRKDFSQKSPPKNLTLPFIFNIFIFNDLIFIYPELSLTTDFLFLFEFILDMGVSILLEQLEYTEFRNIYIPSFTSTFYSKKKNKILTFNKYGVFDYENGIHEISDNQTFPLVEIDGLILNKPFFCIKGEYISVVTTPQNPFKSKKQEKYMWARHPKIAKKWTKKYGKYKKKKKKKK